jgi:superfamily II DNA helicase RecQ
LKDLPQLKSIILVVSPLKALIDDQCDSFKKLGLTAASVGHASWELFILGNVQIVLLTPESLISGKKWREILKTPTYLPAEFGWFYC